MKNLYVKLSAPVSFAFLSPLLLSVSPPIPLQSSPFPAIWHKTPLTVFHYSMKTKFNTWKLSISQLQVDQVSQTRDTYFFSSSLFSLQLFLALRLWLQMKMFDYVHILMNMYSKKKTLKIKLWNVFHLSEEIWIWFGFTLGTRFHNGFFLKM